MRGAAPLDHLPPQIEEIGEEAFHPDSFTDGVEIPTTIQRIAPGAFAGVQVPEFRMEGESDYCCVIDGMLYSADERILIAAKMPDESGTIIIPENTEIIGTKAFTGLPVTHMTIPGSVTLIAQGAFGDCIMLESVTFEEGVENIGSYSFSNTGIKELVTPKSVTRIGEHAFFEAVNLERAVIHTETIESFAFSGCTSLKEVTLEEGLLEIGEYAFQSAAFTDIVFPESLRIIGRSAFGNITYDSDQGDSSESIQLGANISSIGEDAFGALKVQGFTVDEENPLFTTVDGMLTDKAGRTLLACPSGRSGTVTVPEGIYDIAPRAFYGCQGMTDLVIPDSVTSISIHAFDYPSSEDVIKAVIHCSEGSAAHLWAMDNNWPYEIE